ncbi:large conductance mechanosensitive channel protein MscL [Corynebacterium pygosceleis]|uniref:Large-conductance mechanosensitive channel n=1 Tax=Corynebacterium pygosceleis TaxID=2800406 RepID=A0A9Q4C8F9_9CORY|nr:large conductance mechanosensitive channel protein MscL [Corynebacterium pygosceleis]MCK7638123.1 large conductance mechanosensitive channel protein MscL [Corynebacterium pygosceleis]MCK7675837.1 large conductance mechanosensitive channel protein MscL [Corynebacterium pygosceleis]MCL0120781.1 large conductance mechanosensitive channel protein MscL [Corynebacterium pygosceleis]MCX7444322.1 large conductance mechanosensitive channel protein MscL [Corynebacterium pygosceleis]MCX7468839.1 large
MLNGFKNFIMRGNVVDLAVAVVIGAAFTSIVTAFTDNLINPILAVFGGADYAGLGFYLRSGNDATFVDIGAIITAAINFLIIAAVIYFVLVAPMNRVKEMQAARAGQEEEETPAPVEVELLTEIRDLLKEQGQGPAAGRLG